MKNKSIQKVLNNSNFKSYSGLILVIIVVSVFMSIRSENFMTPTNILNVLRQISVYGILACGMAFAMMTGGIDLTVGSTAGVCGALVTKFVVEGNMPLVPAILIGLFVGALLGLLSGVFIAKTGIPPFIMTLGMQITLRGACYLICEGKPIGNIPDSMLSLGIGSLGGIPIPIFFMLGTFVVVGIILSAASARPWQALYCRPGMPPHSPRQAMRLRQRPLLPAQWAACPSAEEKARWWAYSLARSSWASSTTG